MDVAAGVSAGLVAGIGADQGGSTEAMSWRPPPWRVGILVHAYLMYGFPTQTVEDTVDALEYVRWFEGVKVPRTSVPKRRIARALGE